MSALVWTIAALLSHWRRHPMQLAALAVGLMAATALWSGVQALNAQARASYEEAARDLGGGARLVPRAPGATLPQELLPRLRRAGWPVSPVLEGRVRVAGASLRVIGVEPVSLPAGAAAATMGSGMSAEAEGRAGADAAPEDAEREEDAGRALLDFITPPWRTLAAPGTLAALGLAEGDGPATAAGRALPPLAAAPGAPPDALVMDIGAAQALLDEPGRISAFLLGETATAGLPPLADVAPELALREAPAGADLDRLTDSFHMNLTAFGLLAFLVGLFIVHAAIGLAFEQRRPAMRTMRACGVPARTLALALAAELTGFALLAGLAGAALGYAMAAALLPDVAASLRGLYGADVSGELALRPEWWLAAVAMSVGGALVAALGGMWRVWRMPPLDSARPDAWVGAQSRRGARLAVAALGALALGAAATVWPGGLLGGFALMAGIMLGAALALPAALDLLLRLGARAARGAGPLTQWGWADARQQLSGLSLALMALLLALAANVGVGSMVEGFRSTFTGWLDDRLAAELYVRAPSAEAAPALRAWLSARPDVDAVLPQPRVDVRLSGETTELRGFADHPTYRGRWPMLSETRDAWDAIGDGRGAAISEQLARRLDLGLGDTLDLPAPGVPWPVEVVAIYADYGNPKGQARLDAETLAARFPGADVTRFDVRAAPRDVPSLTAALVSAPGGGADRIIDQATLKAESLRIFDRTFAVTAALNALTLGVAGVALFASLATLSGARLPQLAPVWAIGMARRDLAALELGKTLALAAATGALAVPLGIAVAWVLVAVVNVEAFGWRLPLRLFPGQWLTLGALALAAAALAAAGPLLRLARIPPAELGKVFANER